MRKMKTLSIVLTGISVVCMVGSWVVLKSTFKKMDNIVDRMKRDNDALERYSIALARAI